MTLTLVLTGALGCGGIEVHPANAGDTGAGPGVGGDAGTGSGDSTSAVEDPGTVTDDGTAASEDTAVGAGDGTAVTCSADGQCAGVVPVGPCEKAVCAEGACVATSNLALNGSACGNDPCAPGGTCAAGECVGAVAKDCSALDTSSCIVGTCDPVTGACTPVVAADDSTCDDGDPCTTSDGCALGKCVGSPVDCSAYDDGVCTVGSCTAGKCAPVANAGASCTLADPCVVGAECTTEGECAGMPDPTIEGCGCATPSPEGCCNVPEDCDDGLSCTVDACTDGACTHGLQPGHCLVDGACHAEGTLAPSDACSSCDPAVDANGWTAVACAPGGPCIASACDALAGCVTQTQLDGSLCDDGKACSTDDHCVLGACVGNCECTTDADCSAKAGAGACGYAICVEGACKLDPAEDGLECDDGDPCTANDACAQGTCASGSAVVCADPDSDDCTLYVCTTASGGCAASPAAQGDDCNDGQPCTVNDACDGEASCTGAWDVAACGCTVDGDCDDALACTKDVCVAGGNCAASVVAQSCLIDGACHAAGEEQTATGCSCVPEASSTAWTCDPCGNGTLDEGEQCDDENDTKGDGCSPTCTVEDACFVAHAGGSPAKVTAVRVSPIAQASVAGSLVLSTSHSPNPWPAMHQAAVRCGGRFVYMVMNEDKIGGVSVGLDGTLTELEPTGATQPFALYCDDEAGMLFSMGEASKLKVELRSFLVGVGGGLIPLSSKTLTYFGGDAIDGMSLQRIPWSGHLLVHAEVQGGFPSNSQSHDYYVVSVDTQGAFTVEDGPGTLVSDYVQKVIFNPSGTILSYVGYSGSALAYAKVDVEKGLLPVDGSETYLGSGIPSNGFDMVFRPGSDLFYYAGSTSNVGAIMAAEHTASGVTVHSQLTSPGSNRHLHLAHGGAVLIGGNRDPIEVRTFLVSNDGKTLFEVGHVPLSGGSYAFSSGAVVPCPDP